MSNNLEGEENDAQFSVFTGNLKIQISSDLQ